MSKKIDKEQQYEKLVKIFVEKNIIKTIKKQQLKINDKISIFKTINKKEKYFMNLRKWNSYTPLISENDAGGGYFLAWNGKGVVIDPRINFFSNFLRQGLSIMDIDIIILTHSHVDHVSDFEAILTILYEVNSHLKNRNIPPHKVDLYLNIGSISKFMNVISYSYDNIKKVIIVNQNEDHVILPDLKFHSCPSEHNDLSALSKNTCFGLLFESCDGFSFGITSDTRYSPLLNDHYRNVKDSMLVLHIGSIKEDELFSEPILEGIYDKHLGINGVFNLTYDLTPKIVILSELGEELKDVREDICTILNNIFDDTIVIPGDLNLKINLQKNGKPFEFYCKECKVYKNIDDIRCILDDGNNIIYMCNEHK